MRVREPRQQVVVRAGLAPPELAAARSALARSDTPTLLGLDVRERQETLPETDDLVEPGWQCPESDWADEGKTLVALRRRPLVIRESEQDEVAQYRAEARRILESGVFGSWP